MSVESIVNIFLPHSLRKERNMYLKQKDIFRAMNKSFVKKFMNVSTTESYEQGDLLFKQGDLANQFYIFLLQIML